MVLCRQYFYNSIKMSWAIKFVFICTVCLVNTNNMSETGAAQTLPNTTVPVIRNIDGSRAVSPATLQSSIAYKSIPLALNYLYYNEFGDPSAIGVFSVRDIMLDVVNHNRTMLRPYIVSINMWDTKYSSLGNVGITIDLFNKHIAQSCSRDASSCALTRTAINTCPALASRNSSLLVEQLTSYSPPLFFGPEYSTEAKVIAQLAPLLNLVEIAAATGAPDLSDRSKYPNFFRTVISSQAFQGVPRALLTYLNYTTVALANVDDSYGIDPMDKIDYDLRKHGFDVLFHTKFDFVKEGAMDETINSIKLFDARIIIIYSNEPANYRLFCKAIEMLGGVQNFNAKKHLFIFLGIDYDNAVIVPKKIEVPGCTYEMLDAVLNGSLTATFTVWADASDRLDWGMTVAEMKKKAILVSNVTYGDPNVTLSNTLASTIDALWVGLLALDSVEKQLRAEVPMRSLLDFTFQSTDIAYMLKEAIKAVRFHGALGDIAFTADGDFAGRLVIRQFMSRSGGTVDRFYYATDTQKLDLISKPIFGTTNGLPPPDKKPVVAAVDTQNQQLIIILVVIGGALILFCLALYAFYRRNIQQSLVNPNWLIPYDTLLVKSVGMSRASLMGGGSLGKQSDTQRDVTVGMLNDQLVRMQLVVAVDASAKLHVNVQTHRVLSAFRDKLSHPNVVRFVGYSLVPLPPNTHNHNGVREQYLLWEHCEKGSIEQLVESDAQMMKLDAAFEYSILLDVAQGVGFLHKSFIGAHGALCTAACLIDKRFSIKVANYGDTQLAPLFGLDTLVPMTMMNGGAANQHHADNNNNNRASSQQVMLVSGEKRLFWAPELLRDLSFLPQYTHEADAYSFAITMYSLVTRTDPFEAFSSSFASTAPAANNITVSTEDLLDLIRQRNRNPTPYRPSLEPLMHADVRLQKLIQRCWSEQPEERPTFTDITRQLQSISGIKAGGSVTDQLLLRLERYASDMESLVAERTHELESEKRRSDELLNAMLPPEIAKQLKSYGKVEPESFDCVTIYFSDIVGFTTISSMSTPIEVVNLLNALYTMFDGIIDLFDAYKVETIGDAYMVVSGLPNRNGNKHAVHIAKLSMALLDGIQSFVIPHRPTEKLRLRIGLNTGPCVAGVVGIKMPRYCLFGDTVNTASRMESNGEALKIHISETTKRALDEHDGFVTQERGQLEVKGKGTMTTYWLIS